jgi:hypothetical protein
VAKFVDEGIGGLEPAAQVVAPRAAGRTRTTPPCVAAFPEPKIQSVEGDMLESLRRKIALSSFLRSGWGQELQKHTNSVFEGSMLRDFSEKAKRERAEELYLRVMEVDRHAERFTAPTARN